MAKIEVQNSPDPARAARGPIDLSELIGKRAYSLFEQRGCIHGHELEDWLEAERQILDEAFTRHDELLIAGPDGRAGLPVTGEMAHAATAGVGPP